GDGLVRVELNPGAADVRQRHRGRLVLLDRWNRGLGKELPLTRRLGARLGLGLELVLNGPPIPLGDQIVIRRCHRWRSWSPKPARVARRAREGARARIGSR